MGTKTAIVGLLLFAVGAAMLGWVLATEHQERQLQENKQDQIESNLTKLDEVFGDDLDPGLFDGILVTESHVDKSGRKKKREETRELVLTAGGMLVLSGTTVLCFWLLVGTGRLIIKGLSRKSSDNGLRDIKVKRRWRYGAKAKKAAKAESQDEVQTKAKAKVSAEGRKSAKVKAAAKARAKAAANAKARKKEKLKAEKKTKAKEKAKAKAERKAQSKAEKTAKAEAKAKAKAQRETQAKAEKEAKAQAKAEAKRKAKEQSRSRAKAEKHIRQAAGHEASSKKDGTYPHENQHRESERDEATRYSSVLKDSGWANVEVGSDEGEQQACPAELIESAGDLQDAREAVGAQMSTSEPE
ncbi:MAG: hypothetical protein ACYS4W_00440 [Planctomycetota bacterium]|jgi:flagellar biosynthesis GTPase FlhF